MKEILIHFGLQTLVPAALFAGITHALMKWADEYSTAAKKWARDWLTNPTPFNTDPVPALTDIHRLLYGKHFSLRRVAFIAFSIVLVSMLVITLEPTPQSTYPKTVREILFLATMSLFPSAYLSFVSFLVVYFGVMLIAWCSIFISDAVLGVAAKKLRLFSFPIAHFSGFIFVIVSGLIFDQLISANLQGVVLTRFVDALPMALIPLTVLIFVTTSFSLLVTVLIHSSTFVVKCTKYLLPYMGKKEISKKPLSFLAPAASAAAFLSASALLLLAKLSPY